MEILQEEIGQGMKLNEVLAKKQKRVARADYLNTVTTTAVTISLKRGD